MSGLVNMLSVFETFDFCDGNWWVAMLLQLVYGLLTLVSKIMGLFADLMHIAFYIFAGIDLNSESTGVDGIYNIEVAEGRKNILDYFLFSDSMTKAYISLAVIGLLLVVIFTIYRIIKQDYFDRTGPRSKGPIFRNVAISCISFVLVIPIFYLIIHASSLLAVSVMSAMGTSADEFAGAKIFQLSWSDNGEAMRVVNKALSGDPYASEARFQWMWNLNGQTLFSMMADGKYVKYDTTIMKALGKIDKDGNVIPWPGKLAMINNQGVGIYGEFYWYVYLVGIWAALPVLKDMIFAMIQRIFKLMALFLVAPAPISRYVLDDGQAYKKWQRQTIQQGLRVVSATMCFSIYLIALNLISGINFIQPFLNAVNHATHPNPEPQALLNVSTSLLADNGDKGSIGDFVGGVYEFVSKDVIVGSDDLGNPFYSLVNVFMKIILIMGAGGAIRDMDRVVSDMISDDSNGSLDAGKTGEGLSEGMGIVGNTVNKAVSLGMGVAKGVGGVVAKAHASASAAWEGAGNITQEKRKGRSEGIQEAIDEEKEPPVNKKENPNNVEEPVNVDDDNNVNAPKDVNEDNTDNEVNSPNEVNENNTDDEINNDEEEVNNVNNDVNNNNDEEEKDKDDTDNQNNPPKEKNKTPTAKKRKTPDTSEEEDKPKKKKYNKWKSFHGFLGNRLLRSMSKIPGNALKGVLKMPGNLADKALSLGAKGMDALLGKVGLKTNLSKQYGDFRDHMTKTYDDTKKEATKDVERYAKEAHDNAKLQGYKDTKEYQAQKAQNVLKDRSKVVQEDSELLDNAIKNVEKTQGEVNSTTAIANQANDAVTQNIQKQTAPQRQEITDLQNENETILSKHNLTDGDVDAMIHELETQKGVFEGKNGKQAKEMYNDLKKYKSNVTKINDNQNIINSVEQEQNLFSDKDGELTQILKNAGVNKDIKDMSFDEIKKVIDENEQVPDNIKQVFASKGAKTRFNKPAVATAREANGNVVSANQRLAVAKKEEELRRKNLQQSVTELSRAHGVAKHIQEVNSKNNELVDEYGVKVTGYERRKRKVKAKIVNPSGVTETGQQVKEANKLVNKKPSEGGKNVVQGATDYIQSQIDENNNQFTTTTNALLTDGDNNEINIVPDATYLGNNFVNNISKALNGVPKTQLMNVINGAKKVGENGQVYYDFNELDQIVDKNSGLLKGATKKQRQAAIQAYNQFKNDYTTAEQRRKDLGQYQDEGGRVTLRNLVEKHGPEGAKKILKETGYETPELNERINKYGKEKERYDYRNNILNTSKPVVTSTTTSMQTNTEKIRKNVTEFSQHKNTIEELQNIVNSGGRNMTVQQRDRFDELMGTHVTTRDPKIIVQMAKDEIARLSGRQVNLLGETKELSNSNDELIDTLNTMISTLNSALNKGGSLNNIVNNNNNVSGQGTQNPANEIDMGRIHNMAPQDLAHEEWQSEMDTRMHNILVRTESTNNDMHKKISHIEEAVDEIRDDDN